MKKAAILMLFMLGLLALTGCLNRKIATDYTKRYSEYLDYSLGDWKISEEGKGESSLIGTTEFLRWSVEYTDKNNNTRAFYFDNFSSDKTDNYTFGYWIKDHAEKIVREELYNNILKKYFKEDEFGVSEYEENSSKTSAFILIFDELKSKEDKDEFYTSFLSKKDTLKLSEATFEDLIKRNPRYSIQVGVNTAITDAAELEKLKEKCDMLVREINEYCQIPVNLLLELDVVNTGDADEGGVPEGYVRYYVQGVEFPDNEEERKELNLTPSGYLAHNIDRYFAQP